MADNYSKSGLAARRDIRVLADKAAWQNFKIYSANINTQRRYATGLGAEPAATVTFANEIAPNATKLWVHVWGSGGTGALYSANPQVNSTTTGGTGAGYASGVIGITPGQLLPTITVAGITTPASTASAAQGMGYAGATSSFGTLLTATGGVGGVSTTAAINLAGGVGAVAGSVSEAVTARGGNIILPANSTLPSVWFKSGTPAGSIHGAGVDIDALNVNPTAPFLPSRFSNLSAKNQVEYAATESIQQMILAVCRGTLALDMTQTSSLYGGTPPTRTDSTMEPLTYALPFSHAGGSANAGSTNRAYAGQPHALVGCGGGPAGHAAAGTCYPGAGGAGLVVLIWE